ncbi:MAG: biopolymer transporter ExbD [Hellea sp.]|nr:biopolymer transporter ExbD [Hellea sp.]
MSLRKRIRKREDGAVDMTPMLDIVFIMLIFFIVTATFLDESGLDFTHPKNANAEPPCIDCPAPISIYVDADNLVSVDGIVTPVENVADAVSAQLAHNPTAPIILTSHEGARFDPVVRIKDKMDGMGRKTILKISYAQ